MKKIISIAMIFLTLLMLGGCGKKEQIITDAMKFKEEYESLNGKSTDSGKLYREVNISEDNPCEYDFEIKNMVIKPNSASDHSIYVEIEVGIVATSYINQDINVIQDLYSPSKNLKFEQKNIKMIQNKAMFDGTFSINQKEFLNLGDEKVYDVDVDVVSNNVRVNDNEILVSRKCRFIIYLLIKWNDRNSD